MMWVSCISVVSMYDVSYISVLSLYDVGILHQCCEPV